MCKDAGSHLDFVLRVAEALRDKPKPSGNRYSMRSLS
jgi:hypothetical protein